MKSEVARYADSLGLLLDLLSDADSPADSLVQAIEACRLAERELAACADDPAPAREELERCKRLHAMLMAKTGEQLAATGERIGQARKARQALPTPAQQEAQGLSCDMRA